MSAETAAPVRANGKASRLGSLFKKTTKATKSTAREVFIVSKELTLSPLRVLGRMGLNLALDTTEWWEAKLPATIVGVPLATGVVAAGLTGLVAPGALIARCARGANTTLGSVIAGTVGFLAGTALLVWFWEGAAIYAFLETCLFVGKAASAALEDERKRDLALARAA